MKSALVKAVNLDTLPDVTWHDEQTSAVKWGWFGEVPEHVIVGYEPWSSGPGVQVFVLHADLEVLAELVACPQILWCHGKAQAKAKSELENWPWPSAEILDEEGNPTGETFEFGVPVVAGHGLFED